jgi:hypothetical protein
VRKSGIAVALAGALALAACGSSGPSKSSGTTPASNVDGRRVVLASVVKTAAADTAKVSLDLSIKGSGSGAFGVTADGAIDFATGDSQMNLELGGFLSSFLTDGIETRNVDGIAYVRMPSVAGVALPDGKQWISVDASKLELPSSSGDSTLGISGQSNPAKILAYLERVSNGVQQVGTEHVRGEEATHYQASVDLGKAVDRADVPPALRRAVDELQGNTTDIPVDVYVDGEGRVVRLEMDLDLASFLGASGSTGSEGGASIALTQDFYDFGTSVNVEAPPADQVTTIDGFRPPGAVDDDEAA